MSVWSQQRGRAASSLIFILFCRALSWTFSGGLLLLFRVSFQKRTLFLARHSRKTLSGEKRTHCRQSIRRSEDKERETMALPAWLNETSKNAVAPTHREFRPSWKQRHRRDVKFTLCTSTSLVWAAMLLKQQFCKHYGAHQSNIFSTFIHISSTTQFSHPKCWFHIISEETNIFNRWLIKCSFRLFVPL